MNQHFKPVELAKSYRLINHGPTVLISSRHGGVDDVMAAAWCCALDYTPAKITVVLDKITKTRELVERSGTFVIQVPTVAQVQLTREVGSRSLFTEADKLQTAKVERFGVDGFDLPFVAGCSAWLACQVIPEPRNQATYDLFIGEVVGAWADDRVFSDGHWHFETAAPDWRSLHHVSGGHFYAIGDVMAGGK